MTLNEAMAKVTKLLKLSESSNPHEAALAAQRAQEILTRFNIDRTALNMDAGSNEPEEEIEDFTHRSPLDQANRNLSRWKTTLASRIANANQCRVYLSGSAIGIIGRPSDVEKVRYLYAMLVREIDVLTDRDGKGCGRTWRNNYRYGVVAAIADKLAAAKAKVVNEMRSENTGTALVRVNDAIAKVEEKDRSVETWMRSKLNLRSGRSTRVNSDHNARQAGYAAGQSINLSSARGALGGVSKKLR